MKPDLSTESRKQCIREAHDMSDNPKHTPGPWRVRGDWDEAVRDSQGLLVAEIQTMWPEASANAHLIAAAPDMLKMLKRVADEEAEMPNLKLRDQYYIHELIAKAEGREVQDDNTK